MASIASDRKMQDSNQNGTIIVAVLSIVVAPVSDKFVHAVECNRKKHPSVDSMVP